MASTDMPGGWPLRLAISALAPASLRRLADDFVQLETLLAARGGLPGSTESVRRHLWLSLCERILAGEVVARGFVFGEKGVEAIAPAFFSRANPDYDGDRVTAHGVTYHDVRLFLAHECRNLLPRRDPQRLL